MAFLQIIFYHGFSRAEMKAGFVCMRGRQEEAVKASQRVFFNLPCAPLPKKVFIYKLFYIRRFQ
ncbi:MAG TPA: hypothetical protein DHU26_02245 [Spirochaetaceae bacterium]|nr:hypothetical protein [Spirochaetaceae bacterium]